MAKPTPRVLALQKQFFDQYKKNKDSWVKKYGADAESVMTGAAFKRAESVAMKENKQRVKEAIKKALTNAPTKENPIDTITLDVPLLIRIMEYSKEDAQTDMDLHKVAEKIIELSKQGKTLTMEDYSYIVNISNDQK
jgi:hypothetical protein